MKAKKIIYLLATLLCFSVAFSQAEFLVTTKINSQAVVASESQPVFENNFRELTAEELVDEMGIGWNLGNRFDSGSESGWGNPKITQEFFRRVHDMSYNTVRVPVTWRNNLGSSPPYTLNQTYLDRVQDVVDYIISLDMYVAVNMHHDGWISTGVDSYRTQGPNNPTWITTKERYAAGWRQIAERFKDYDEHLLFESMNEVAGTDASPAGIKSDTKAIMELNQIFTDEIRATGGNNAKRWLIVCGRYTNIDTAADKSNGFKFPDDPLNATNKFMFSIHDYDYQLGLSNPGIPGFSRAQALAYSGQIQKLINGYSSQGIPIFFGEYGAGDKTYFQEDNDKAVAYWFEMMNAYFKKCMAVGVVWDNGSMKIGTGGPTSNDYFAVINRNDGTPWRPYVIDATMRGYRCYDEYKLAEIYNAIPGDDKNFTPVIPVTNITLSESSLKLRVGSQYRVTAHVEPANNNDPIIWTSSDYSVATVYNGLIRAKRPGTATITAYAQSTRDTGRTMQATLTVTVYPDDSLISDGAINVDESVTITGTLWRANDENTNWTQAPTVAQPNAYLNVTTSGLRKNDKVIYHSSDPSVVSVNTVGKLVGIFEGKAYLTVSTLSGIQKQVLVTVGTPSGGVDATSLTPSSNNIALNASEPMKTISVTVGPENADEKVLFISSNNNVVIPSSGLAVKPSSGSVSMDLIAVGNGTAIITAKTPSGASCEIEVTVSGFTPSYDDERVYRENDPSDIAPVVTIDMPDEIIRNWFSKVNYEATTTNPDVKAPLKITMNVTMGGFELELKNGIFKPTSFGEILVRVKAEDEFGNSSFASKVINVVHGTAPSKTPPTIVFDMRDNIATGDSIEIKFNVTSDNDSLPESYDDFDVTVSVKYGDTDVEVTNIDGRLYFTPQEAGSYVISVSAQDGYGNAKTETYSVEAVAMYALTINSVPQISNVKIDNESVLKKYAPGTYELTFDVESGYKAVVKVNNSEVKATNGKYVITIDGETTVDIFVTEAGEKRGCKSSVLPILMALLPLALAFSKKKII